MLFRSISENDDDQFVELHNFGPAPVPLDGWQIEGGISFSFPANTTLAPAGFLVVARNAARLLTNYPALNPATCLGNFSGRLSRRGETLSLTRPAILTSTNQQGQVVTNQSRVVVDELTYADGGRWGSWADGGGSSLEKIDPRADSRLAPNWADSDESRKAPWTTVELTGRLDLGNTPADQLQVLLLGAGECLLDDVEVLNADRLNLVANPDFESGASGWTAQGTLSASGWDASEGHHSARSYRIRAVDRGDNQLNRVRTPLRQTLPANSIATFRARFRWLKGSPKALLRLRGNWLEAPVNLQVPANPGTPGAPNSRAADNSGPAITETSHSPILPAAGQPVRITCRVSDPDSVTALRLLYRLDPATQLRTLTMTDDGTGGDALAGDGIHTATLPGQAAGTLVAFRITGTDSRNATTSFPANPSAGECLIRFGESIPTGNFPVYRLWMTQATLNEWTRRDKLNNTPLDITFVAGDHRVIYNARALYAGSPYIAPGYSSPASGRCGYSLSFPPDDRFLGDTDLVLDWPGGHGGERTAMQERMAYWLAEQLDLPYSHRYVIRLFVNGVSDMDRRAVFEAVNQPASDFVEAWLPNDSEGDFFKIDRAFEFSDSGSLIADPIDRKSVV